MRKFLFYSADTTDACSFYRGIGPFSQLWRLGWEMVRAPQYIDWASIAGPEIGVMQRPYSPTHLKIAETIKEQMPLWLDYDDLFTDVPPSNPSFDTFSEPEVRDSLKAMLQLADVVTTSTGYLGNRIGALVPRSCRIRVIPNAYNDYLLPIGKLEQEREKVICWRGSKTHYSDLLTYGNDIAKVAKAHPDWRFVFLGATPWMLQGKLGMEWHPKLGIFKYHSYLRDELRPAIYQVPLADNPFNRAKSNVSWIEGTMADGLCVMPSFIDAPGSVQYSRDLSYWDALEAAIYLITSGESFTYIKKARLSVPMLSEVNRQRAEILRSLVGE